MEEDEDQLENTKGKKKGNSEKKEKVKKWVQKNCK